MMRKLLFLPLLFSLLSGCGNVRTDQMRTLLHEQDSLNRAYQHLSLDTIYQLTDYFDRHGPNYDRVHSHYLLGSALRDLREAPAALDAFQQAAELADTTAGGDSIYALLAKIHGQIGNLFIKQYLPHEAIKEYRRASYYAMLNGDTVDALQRRLGVLHCLRLLNERDSLLQETRLLYKELCSSHHPEKAASVLGPAIRVMLEGKDFTAAKNYLDIYLSSPDTSMTKKRQDIAYYYLLGEYYLGVDRPDSAEYFYRKELREGRDQGHQVRALRGLYHLYSRHVVVDSLIKYTTAYNDLNDSSNIMRESEAMLNMQSLYDYSRYEKAAMEKTIETQRSKHLLQICIACFLLSGIGLLIYLRMRKEMVRQKMEKLITDYRSNLRLLNQLSMEKAIMQSENLSLGEKSSLLQDEIDRLKDLVLEQEKELSIFREASIEDTPIYHTLCESVSDKRPLSPSDMRKLIAAIQENMPLFAGHLQGYEKDLSLQEQSICILIRLGFHSKDISNLIGISPQSLSNSKKKMLRLLFQIDGRANELNDRLQLDW